MQRSPFNLQDLLWKSGITVAYLAFLFLFIKILNLLFA